MTTRYQKRHYEDVAQFLKTNKPHNNYGNPSTAQNLLKGYHGMLCGRFADSFAADNPPVCQVGSHDGPCTPTCLIEGSGFDRARFLAACGLESEGA